MNLGQIARTAGKIAVGGAVVGGTALFVHTLTRGGTPEATAQSLIRAYDADGSGAIDVASEASFTTWIKCTRYGRDVNERTTVDASRLFGSLAGADGVLGQSELVAHLRSNWDTNGNGRISLREHRNGEYADGITSSNTCTRA